MGTRGKGPRPLVTDNPGEARVGVFWKCVSGNGNGAFRRKEQNCTAKDS